MENKIINADKIIKAGNCLKDLAKILTAIEILILIIIIALNARAGSQLQASAGGSQGISLIFTAIFIYINYVIIKIIYKAGDYLVKSVNQVETK